LQRDSASPSSRAEPRESNMTVTLLFLALLPVQPSPSPTELSLLPCRLIAVPTEFPAFSLPIDEQRDPAEVSYSETAREQNEEEEEEEQELHHHPALDRPSYEIVHFNFSSSLIVSPHLSRLHIFAGRPRCMRGPPAERSASARCRSRTLIG